MNLLTRILFFRNWPLPFKLSLVIALAALLPLLIGLSGMFNSRFQSALQEARSDAQGIAWSTANILADKIVAARLAALETTLVLTNEGRMLDFAREWGQTAPLSAVPESNTILAQNLLTRELANLSDYRTIRLLSTGGRLLAVTGDLSGTPHFRDTNQSQSITYTYLRQPGLMAGSAGPLNVRSQAVLVPPYEAPFTAALVLDVGTALRDPDTNSLLGYLIFSLDTEIFIESALADLQANFADRVDRLYLVSAQGRLLSRLEALEPFQFDLALDPFAAADGSLGESGTASYEALLDGQRQSVVAAYAALPALDGYVIAEVGSQGLVAVELDFLLLVLAITLLVSGTLIVLMLWQGVFPINRITRTALRVASGDLEARTRLRPRHDEIGMLDAALKHITAQLSQSLAATQQRIAAHTRDLESILTIGQVIATTDTLRDLLNTTVEQIVARFDSIYHAQVFLIDSSGEYAEIVASSGEVGRRLVELRHRLAVGGISVIGRVTEAGQPIIARDTSTSRIQRWNEFLSDTRAEMALPLIHQGRVIGALDVQSKEAAAFSAEEQRLFVMLAEQFSAAIARANLFAEIERHIVETESLNQLLMREAWGRTLASSHRRGFLEIASDDSPPQSRPSEWQQRAIHLGDLVVSPPHNGMLTLALPIMQRDQTFGAVEWQLAEERDSENLRLMARQLVGRLATTLETIRLLERSERLARRERLLNDISNNLISQPNVPFILRTAVQELSRVLETTHVRIQLTPSADDSRADPLVATPNEVEA